MFQYTLRFSFAWSLSFLLPLRDPSVLDSVVERLGLVAGDGVLFVVASQGLLVEDGGVAADEGPVGSFDDGAEVVLDGKADVEHLAVVGNVSVVAVLAAFAGEAFGER